MKSSKRIKGKGKKCFVISVHVDEIQSICEEVPVSAIAANMSTTVPAIMSTAINMSTTVASTMPTTTVTLSTIAASMSTTGSSTTAAQSTSLST